MPTTPNLGLPHMNSALTTAIAKMDAWNNILLGLNGTSKGFSAMFYLRVLDVSSWFDPHEISSPLFPGAYIFAGVLTGNLGVKLLEQKGFYLFFNQTTSSPSATLTVQMGTGSPLTGGNIVTIPQDGKFHFVYADGNGNLFTAS